MSSGIVQSRPVGDRILTTHAGSLPRPAALVPLILAQAAGEPVDEAALRAEVRDAVELTVAKQVEAGVDIVDDGEVSKASYATYVKDRLTGFGGEAEMDPAASIDAEAFPDFAAMMAEAAVEGEVAYAGCDGPVRYVGHEALAADIENLRAATSGAAPAGAFMSAASPGVISIFSPNRHYATEDEYLEALACAMREEYEAIHEAGLLLQLDCLDFAWSASAAPSLGVFLERLEHSVEALNLALEGIPAEAARVHVCWGNGQYPRTGDIELRRIIEVIFKAKPAGIMVMGANGRHAHEWAVFQDVRLPDGKHLIPGVIDSASNVVEHPELVAQRLEQYARVVGRENVMASSDCGFAPAAGGDGVAPTVVWAKLRAMAEGARIASERLWP